MNFKGISHVKWNYPPKIEKIKAISYVKLKVSISHVKWNNPPKGIEKIKAISYVTLKVS